MKALNLREQTDEELAQLQVDTTRQLFMAGIKRGQGDSSEQPLLVRTLRRDVARIKTVIRERELEKNG